GTIDVAAAEQEADLTRHAEHARVEPAERPEALSRDRERDDRREKQRVRRVVPLLNEVEEGDDVHRSARFTGSRTIAKPIAPSGGRAPAAPGAGPSRRLSLPPGAVSLAPWRVGKGSARSPSRCRSRSPPARALPPSHGPRSRTAGSRETSARSTSPAVD